MRPLIWTIIGVVGFSLVSQTSARNCACAKRESDLVDSVGFKPGKMGVLAKKTCLTHVRTEHKGWFGKWALVKYKNKDAWIRAKNVKVSKCVEESRQCACSIGNVNIRSGASTANHILSVLKVGDCLPYKGRQVPVGGTNWAQVEYHNQNAFVSARYLSFRTCGTETDINQCACATGDVNIREGASTANEKLGVLLKGTCVPFRGDQVPVRSSNWAHVDFAGKDAYISTSYLTFAACSGNKDSLQCVCASSGVNIRSGAGTSNSIVGGLSPGHCLPFSGTETHSGNLRWSQVQYNNQDAFIASKYLIFKACN